MKRGKPFRPVSSSIENFRWKVALGYILSQVFQWTCKLPLDTEGLLVAYIAKRGVSHPEHSQSPASELGCLHISLRKASSPRFEALI